MGFNRELIDEEFEELLKQDTFGGDFDFLRGLRLGAGSLDF